MWVGQGMPLHSHAIPLPGWYKYDFARRILYQACSTLTSIVVFGNVSVCTPLWVFPDLKMVAQSMNVVGVSCIMPVLASVGEENKILLF